MGNFFSHPNGLEMSFSDSDRQDGSYLNARSMASHNNPSLMLKGENMSIQKQKQMFARHTIDGSTKDHYIKNIINYDTIEFEKVSSMVNIEDSVGNDFLKNLKKHGFDYHQKTMLNFHCIYCHLLKVLVYHPMKTKVGHTGKTLNAENQYAKEYDYLSAKIGKVITHSLKHRQYPGFDVAKKITLGRLNTFVNSVEVNTADMYSYLHTFENKTGEDITLEQYYKDLAKALNDLNEPDLDIVQEMLSWVIEDCDALFVTPPVEDYDSEYEDDDEGFNFDAEAFRLEIEQNSTKQDKSLSVGQQTWFKRRQEQYAYYEQIAFPDTKSILEEKNIRPVSYLKIYELLMSGIGLKNKKLVFSLEDFMTICFVGWVHDGKWEDGIRA